jgi:hypothetical protein
MKKKFKRNLLNKDRVSSRNLDVIEEIRLRSGGGSFTDIFYTMRWSVSLALDLNSFNRK